MSRLIYGIVFASRRAGAEVPLELPPGVAGAPVSLLEDGRLAAAIATIEAAALTPTVESVTAYAGVVEVLHANRTVLPMRYGCVVHGDAAVIQLLHARVGAYTEMLRDLHGCEEMGIRILVGNAAAGRDTCARVDHSASGAGQLTGTAYLAWRKRVQAAANRAARQHTELLDRISSAFEGQFVRCKTESHPVASGPTSVASLSLHFLVKRESVDSFRRIFHCVRRAADQRLLLSGPWPPYNFVAPEM